MRKLKFVFVGRAEASWSFEHIVQAVRDLAEKDATIKDGLQFRLIGHIPKSFWLQFYFFFSMLFQSIGKSLLRTLSQQ